MAKAEDTADDALIAQEEVVFKVFVFALYWKLELFTYKDWLLEPEIAKVGYQTPVEVLFIVIVAVDDATPCATNISNWVLSPFVKVIVDEFTEAVIMPLRGREEVIAFVAQLAVPNREPVKLVAFTLPVTITDPVIIADPVITIVSALVDNSVVELLPDNIKEPVIIWFPTNEFEPVVAKDADLATNTGSVSL